LQPDVLLEAAVSAAPPGHAVGVEQVEVGDAQVGHAEASAERNRVGGLDHGDAVTEELSELERIERAGPTHETPALPWDQVVVVVASGERAAEVEVELEGVIAQRLHGELGGRLVAGEAEVAVERI